MVYRLSRNPSQQKKELKIKDISHDVIENKGRAKRHFDISHDVDENN
jgi:hypothetical protein